MIHDTLTGTEVAIIGMAGRFPGAATLEHFWKNLASGVEAITFFSDEALINEGIHQETLHNPAFVRAKGYLPDVELFDASFFGYSPREAELLDPQHRLLLAYCWAALEDAGYDPDRCTQAIGVYASASPNTYFLSNIFLHNAIFSTENMLQVLIASSHDFLATRVSYKLNLHGPSVNVQTACSSSLVALHMACQSLLSRECDMALVAGASITIPNVAGYLFQEGGINSPDGHCRAFSAEAMGTVRGNGIGVVLLKRLQEAMDDRDLIYAVIKGTAINNDGSQKVGFTAPGVQGQANVIADALALAECEPETITYIETHGTATSLGDLAEISALKEVFGEHGPHYCALGSVKSNIGHLDAAAGIAGVIKTALALKHRQIPPSLHCSRPNPTIDLEHSPFFVNTDLRPWETNKHPRRAGISSFGIGGTNAHVILQEAPSTKQEDIPADWHLLILSARTPTSLQIAIRQLAAFMRQHPEIPIADVAYTLQIGRKQFNYRRTLVCQRHEEAATRLEQTDELTAYAPDTSLASTSVTFMFPGQGTQYVNMGREIYESEPIFRTSMDECARLLQPHLNLDIRTLLYPSATHALEMERLLSETQFTQPAIFATSYALAQFWLSLGLKPQTMIGHSMGEYVAACLANVFSLEEALTLVAIRGKLIQQLPKGLMLAIALPAEQVASLLEKEISFSAINSSEQCVVAGPTAAIERLSKRLQELWGHGGRLLQTSHAFHTPMMEPIREFFIQVVRRVALKQPQIPYLSNVTGDWITPQNATDPEYWGEHLCKPIRFADNLTRLGEVQPQLLLEVGPGQTLSSLVRRHLKTQVQHPIFSSLPPGRHSEVMHMLTTLGKLWSEGIEVDWPAMHANTRRQRISLPTYPFEPRRYWIERPQTSAIHNAGDALLKLAEQQDATSHLPAAEKEINLHPRTGLTTPYRAPTNETQHAIAAIWQEILGIPDVGIEDNFIELGGDSLLAMQVHSRLQMFFQQTIPITALYLHPTIAELATFYHIQVSQAEMPPYTKANADLEQVFQDIEGLPQEEIESLIHLLEADNTSKEN